MQKEFGEIKIHKRNIAIPATDTSKWVKLDINYEFRKIPLEIRNQMWKENKQSQIQKRSNFVRRNVQTIFTEKYSEFDGRIITREEIGFANGKSMHVISQWDCGATVTSISAELANMLNLKPIGTSNVDTTSSTMRTNVYDIEFFLRDSDDYMNVQVYETPVIHKTGIDMLIGMDIISKGDFAISTYKGQTCFSFRIPSKGHIDFKKNRKFKL